MYIYILKCGPGLLLLGLNWPSVQVEFDMPGLESRLTNGGEIVNLAHRPRPIPQKHFICLLYYFLLEAE
jgi:hypothetical protein